MKVVDEITTDLGKAITLLLKKDTACAHCGQVLEKKKAHLFVAGVGALHDSCYRELVRQFAVSRV